MSWIQSEEKGGEQLKERQKKKGRRRRRKEKGALWPWKGKSISSRDPKLI